MNNMKFTNKDCDYVIKKCLQTNNVQTVDFEIIPQHKNFIFKITGECDSKKETLCLFAKLKTKPPQIDKIFYQDFKTTLEGFNPKITPKFYCGKSELLFFEDLTCQKFQTGPHVFDLKHLHQVLKVIAGFHAAGFAFDTVKTKKLEEELTNSSFDIREAEDLLWSCIDNKESINEIDRQLEERQVCEKFAKTLCHSNLKSANILFHYNNGNPDECRLINFKSIFAPPVYDVLQVIFLNTSEEFRRENFDTLLDYYYERLVEEMKKYHLDVDAILSPDAFRLSSHYILPLIKVEVALMQKKNGSINSNKVKQELKEILTFPSLSREDCYVIVTNALKSSDYDFLSFRTISCEGVNLSKLMIKVRHFIEEKSVNCFIKYLSKEEKETFFYKVIIPQFQQLGIGHINCCLPVSYFQRPQDLIVFEDMTTLNFRFLSTVNPTDFSLLSIIIKKLAKLHSCSLIFEEKKSEKLKTNYRMIDNYESCLTDSLPKNFEKVKDFVLKITNLFSELKIGEENLKKLKMLHQVGVSSDRFRNVICHGDVRSKNILVQCDDDVPIDCRFINCHSIKYSPAAYDFLSAIFLTTNRETRIKNEETLTQMYYLELEKTMSSNGYRANKFFSYEEFLESVELTKPQIVLQALMYNIFTLCVPEKVSSIEDACNWVLQEPKLFEKMEAFKKELLSNVIDLYEVCNIMLPNFQV